MFKNYILVAVRNFWRNRVFSVINILGLAIGISASLVIYLLVSYDFSFDKFYKDKERIYRVVSDFEFSGQEYHNSGVCSPMAAALKKEVTGMDVVAPFYTWDDGLKVSLAYPNANNPVVLKKQGATIFADENYFSLFAYTWLAGSPKTSFTQPYQLVLTESRAKTYFPNLPVTNIIGKVVTFNDTVHATVTGIVKDMEDGNTDFTFKAFLSLITLQKNSFHMAQYDQWGSTNGASQLFVKLSAGTTAAQLTPKILNLYNAHHKQDPEDHSKTSYRLQPLNDVHFNNTYGNFNGGRIAHKPTLYGLLAVAAFLLLLACINFINLTTSQASQRAKEIGIRKTMGSTKKQLTFQFLSETFLLTFIATLLSVAITPLLLKVFADFIPQGLHFSLGKQPGIILFLVLLIVLVSLLSGFYPALMLSSYNPVLVLKNQAFGNTSKTRSAWLRKGLTVSQFVIAQVFIIATILVSKQISYSLNKDLGFKKDAILYFGTNFYDTVNAHKSVLINKLKAIPEIATVSLANNPPSTNSTWSSTMKYKDGKKEIETDVQIKIADTNYISLFNLKLLAGHNLPASDTTNAMIINETYAHILGFKNPQQALGKYVDWNTKTEIIGVVSDFNQKSLHELIQPLVIANGDKSSVNINVALQPQNAEGTVWKAGISKIEKAFKEVYPGDDFEYTFLDDTIAKYYTAEKNISRLLMWATGLAIFISCLGLLGLVIYVTNQRTKEIGIRKVVGASVAQIIALLSKDFLALIAMAFVIAVPVAWWGANKWLENFAYKTTLAWWIFASGGAAMLILAFVVMLVRTFRAATANPVESLRAE
jgi:putative ABC transport system permease protein